MTRKAKPARKGKIIWQLFLQQFFATHKRQLLLGAALAALTTLMGCALLGISGWFITSTAIAGLSASGALMFDVFTPSASIRLLALGRTASRYAERLVTHDATLAVLVRLREKLFLGWAKPDAARLLLLRPARLLFRLTRDLDSLENIYLRLLVPGFAALSTAVLLGIFTGFIELWLGIAGFVWLAGSGLGIAAWMGRRAILHSALHAKALERLRADAIDLVAGQTDLIMAQQLQAQQNKVIRADLRLSQTDLTLNRIEARGTWLFSFTQSFGIAAALLAGAWLMRQGTIGAPVAALLVLLVMAAAEPFAGLRRGAMEAGKTWLAARRLTPTLSATASTESPQQLPPDAGFAVQAQQLQHRYFTSHMAYPAVTGIDLNIRSGEHVAIVGPSGCGKSTLLALLANELPLQQGVLAIGPNIWLTQKTELFQDTVRGNLNLSNADLTDEQLWIALQSAHLAQDIQNASHGLDTWLGEGGLGLSGGQARRLALARMYLSSSDLWLMDEPTESLDAAIAETVLRALKHQADGKTLLIATHLAREALLADRLIRMESGRIVETAERSSPAFAHIIQSLRTG